MPQSRRGAAAASGSDSGQQQRQRRSAATAEGRQVYAGWRRRHEELADAVQLSHSARNQRRLARNQSHSARNQSGIARQHAIQRRSIDSMSARIQSLESEIEQLRMELLTAQADAHFAASDASDRLRGTHLCLRAAVRQCCVRSLGRCAFMLSGRLGRFLSATADVPGCARS